jgi:uncharacterized repeat protein (TIGR01451 family)
MLTFAVGLQLRTDAQTLTWLRNKDDAMAAARAEGKLVLLLAGRDTCSNCKTMKNTVAESQNPPIKELLQQHFILWYSIVDTSSEYTKYDDGLRGGWGLPLICVINPNNPDGFLSRSTGVQQAPVFYQRILADVATLPPPLPPPPVITGFEPASGTAGMTVTILGTSLTNVTSVTFNGIPAVFTHEGALQAIVPANATTGPIVVTTASGTGTSPTSFEVPPPEITSFEPASGSVGATVSILGTSLTNVTSVEFNGVPAAFTTEGGLQAIVPANATTGPIVVKTANGIATSSGPFEVVVIIPHSSTADLAVTAQGETFIRDGEVRALFKVTVTNFGPMTASGIVISNILSRGESDAEPEIVLWQPRSLASNAWTSFSFEVGHVPTTNLICRTTVRATQPDLAPENNSVTTTPQPRLSINQSAPNADNSSNDKISLAWPGGDASWKLQVTDPSTGQALEWGAVNEVPVQQNIQYQVDLPIPTAPESRLYRLVK